METFILNGLTVTRRSIFHEYEIYSPRGCWLNTFRDLIDVQTFCNNPDRDYQYFIRAGEYERNGEVWA